MATSCTASKPVHAYVLLIRRGRIVYFYVVKLKTALARASHKACIGLPLRTISEIASTSQYSSAAFKVQGSVIIKGIIFLLLQLKYKTKRKKWEDRGGCKL